MNALWAFTAPYQGDFKKQCVSPIIVRFVSAPSALLLIFQVSPDYRQFITCGNICEFGFTRQPVDNVFCKFLYMINTLVVLMEIWEPPVHIEDFTVPASQYPKAAILSV